MLCATCGDDVKVYELFPRSYRLYAYMCRGCMQGFLAHHFDLDLEIYQMDKLEMQVDGDLMFITGLKVEPRVFDFEIGPEIDSVVIVDEKNAFGELALGNTPVFSPYSEKALRGLKRKLGLGSSDLEKVTNEVYRRWRASK